LDVVLNCVNRFVLPDAVEVFATQFNTTSDDYLSFTINVTDTSVALQCTLYSKDNSSQIQNFVCYAGSYPCVCTTSESLPSGSYYLFVNDWSDEWDLESNSSSASYCNITMSFSYGNVNCMNITSQLDTCAGYLSPDDYYSLQNSVADYEARAIFVYNTLASLWPSNCSSSLWTYACKSVFQPRLCDNSTGGNLTNTYYCSNDCLETLQSQCLNGSEPNLCQKNTCTTVSNLIYECSANFNSTFLYNSNGTQLDNAGNMMNISWFVGLLLIIVNWLVAIQ